jgi:histidyl-tRNA synthetase
VRAKAYEITQLLRKNDIKADVDLNGKKFKKLMNHADKIKVPKMAIIGENDLKENKITIKDMASGNQELVEIDDLIEYLKEE